MVAAVFSISPATAAGALSIGPRSTTATGFAQGSRPRPNQRGKARPRPGDPDPASRPGLPTLDAIVVSQVGAAHVGHGSFSLWGGVGCGGVWSARGDRSPARPARRGVDIFSVTLVFVWLRVFRGIGRYLCCDGPDVEKWHLTLTPSCCDVPICARD